MIRAIPAFIIAFVLGFAINASGWGGMPGSRQFAGNPVARGASATTAAAPAPGGPSTLLTNIVYWQKFDSNITQEIAATDGGPSFSGIEYGAVNYPAGILGQAKDFSLATGGYEIVGASGGGVVSGAAWTVSFWAKMNALPAGYNPFWVNATTGQGLYQDTSTLIYYENGNKTGTAGVLGTGAWLHIVTTYNGSNFAFYVNTAPAGTPASVTGTLEFNYVGFNTITRLNGSMDEFGVWGRVLTPTEISTLYNGGAAVTYPFTGSP